MVKYSLDANCGIRGIVFLVLLFLTVADTQLFPRAFFNRLNIPCVITVGEEKVNLTSIMSELTEKARANKAAARHTDTNYRQEAFYDPTFSESFIARDALSWLPIPSQQPHAEVEAPIKDVYRNLQLYLVVADSRILDHNLHNDNPIYLELFQNLKKNASVLLYHLYENMKKLQIEPVTGPCQNTNKEFEMLQNTRTERELISASFLTRYTILADYTWGMFFNYTWLSHENC
ncbi:uncharacterized protein LOC106465278 [Limulus polyphemus]|uniref:Uncharacterized protein LOC106465278 n=1 Tax=Limulus polyphemus TaxID=6850 RepID=A0ABM1BFG7_LIMPO|nr:uncharacterized protein LOC106465278 [Limulus polyphemus]